MEVRGNDEGVWIAPHYSLQHDMILLDDKRVVGQAESPEHVVVSPDERWLAYFFNQTLVVRNNDKGWNQLMVLNVSVKRLDWVSEQSVCFSTTDKRRWQVSVATGKREDLGITDSLYESRVFSVSEALYVVKRNDKFWVGDTELGFAPTWYDGKEFLP